MRGLYAILDVDAAEQWGLRPPDLVEPLLMGQPAVVQIRAKREVASGSLELLQRTVRARDRIFPRGSGARRPLVFANDRPDLALLAHCDGVHVGQDDLPPAEVRRLAPRLQLGVSTHTREQLLAALEQAPDYIAFGPIYPTRSKRQPDEVVGIDRLRQAHAATMAASVPLVAIGGIDATRFPEVAPHCEMIAVIGALFAGGVEPQALTAQVLGLQAASRPRQGA
jgi:thiamine-phosphate pyrophosphorylase